MVLAKEKSASADAGDYISADQWAARAKAATTEIDRTVYAIYAGHNAAGEGLTKDDCPFAAGSEEGELRDIWLHHFKMAADVKARDTAQWWQRI